MAGLQSVIGESVQNMLLPGECRDLYYAGVSNVTKACFSSRVNNKFYVDLSSKTPGSTSVITFNPNQGVTDIVLELQLPDLSALFASTSGVALAPGWGYACIDNLSYRFATAQQLFVQGEQHFISVIDSVDDFIKRDTIIQLGGQALVTSADFANVSKRTAYVYIKIPSNTPNHNKHLPYPSDLTTQPLQLTIQLASIQKLFGLSAGVSLPSFTFDKAQICFRQVELNNTQDLLSQREDMVKKMYIYPLDRFEQRQIPIPVGNSGGVTSVQLTGFRSGMISHIVLMAKNLDSGAYNCFDFAPISNIVLTINGDVRYDTRDQSSLLWDTITNALPTLYNNAIVTPGNPGTAVTQSGYYVKIPLGQEANREGNEYELVDGYSVMNSVLNLQLQLPANTNGYTLFATYWYRSALSINNGNVDWVF